MKNPRAFLPIAIIIATLAVSTGSIFVRLAQREAPSLVIAALRLTLATLALAPFAFIRLRDSFRRLARRDGLLILLSGVFLAAHFATWITSLEYTTVVSSVVLVSTGPLWVAILAPIFLREIPTRWIWIGMTLALLGGVIVGISDSCTSSGLHISCPPLSQLTAGSAFYGNFLALCGAWAVAGYLMVGRALRSKVELIPYITLVYGIAACLLLVTAKLTSESFSGYSITTYLFIVALALIPQLIGHSTYNWALKYMPVSLVSITTLGEPIGSAILAFFILKEAPSIITIGGGLLILAGIYISSKQT